MSSPQALTAAHLAGDPTALAWLGERWTGIRPCAERTRAFLIAGDWDRNALADLATGCGASRAAVAALADRNGAVVVTGQQPAVGGGPLYTLVKLAHAIALARRLAEEGVPATAWFWCASEDHDVGEANHADLVLRDGSIARTSVDLGPGRAALRWRPASLWWDPLVARCRQQLGTGLGSRWLDEHAPVDGEGMGAWLCRMVTDLFAGHPVVACEAHLLRPFWAGRLPNALTHWPVRALEERRTELLAHGHSDPFGGLAAAPLFLDRSDGRTALAAGAVAPLLSDGATGISPGAALRPVLQQVALPASVAILGPGEIAYHAALGPIYPVMEAFPPQLVPRCSLTLLPAWAARAAQRLGLDPAALADGAAMQPAPPHDPQSQRLAALAHGIEALASDASPGDRRIAAAQVRMRRELDRLRASLARGARAAAGLPAPGSLGGLLRPRSRRQERVMSLFQAIWEHGPGLAAELVHAASETAPGEHRLVQLAG